MEILQVVLLVLFVAVAFFLVLMVLIQDDQGDGLAGMFGGGSSSTFGSRAGNVLTKTTSVLGALFLITAIALAFLFKTPATGDLSSVARKNQTSAQEWWNQDAKPVQATPAPTTDVTTAAPAAPAVAVPAAGTEATAAKATAPAQPAKAQ